MARVSFTGFETGSLLGEPGTSTTSTVQPAVTGSVAIESTIVRSGSYSLKLTPASGAAGYWEWGATGSFPEPAYIRFYLRITTLPAIARMLVGTSVASVGLLLNPDGTITIGTTGGSATSSTALTNTSRWYKIGIEWVSGAHVLWIDGISEATAAGTGSLSAKFGANDTVAATYTAYIDDLIRDSAVLPGDGKIVMLKPTADSAGGTGWRLGTNTALGGNGFGSVDNTPPQGVADLAVGSDPKQIRNATSNANDSYDATVQSYSAAGIGARDTINSLFAFAQTAAPVTTSSKQGTLGIVSNPAVANVALGNVGTAGAFWSGTTAGTFKTGWKYNMGTITDSPSVTIGTAPVMRMTQVTSSTRIAMVCFMGIYVDYTPSVSQPNYPRHRNYIIR